MFTEVISPTGHFALRPMPNIFFETPSPFGNGALLVLNRFDNNSARLRSEHQLGIMIAAAQAQVTLSLSTAAFEVYGITDRSGSEALNLALSRRRAEAAMDAIRAAMSLGGNIVFTNGLGERLADEYFQLPDDTRNANFRGVACYLWESFSTARDPFLRLSVAFAAPPTGGSPLNRRFLSALHMGRIRAQPRSTFA